PESDSERLARRCACLADAREEEAEVCAAMRPSLYPWGPGAEPRHDDKRRSHVLGQFPQGRPTPSPYQTITPSTSHPNSSAALGAPFCAPLDSARAATGSWLLARLSESIREVSAHRPELITSKTFTAILGQFAAMLGLASTYGYVSAFPDSL